MPFRPTWLVRRKLSLLPVALCLTATMAFTAPSVLHAQAQNTGELSGNISDQGHALVPNASVQLVNEDKGNVLTTKANAQGQYAFHDLLVGSYTLRVTAQGFSAFESHHISIDADSRFRVDAELKPGDVQATVQVDADAVAVDTQSATVQQVIDNQLVENLPLDGNNVVGLAAMLPGVTDVSAPTTFTDENGGATYSSNGSRSGSNLYLFDGLLWNNLYLNTGLNYPNHAVLNQVSVQLNNYTAQYGRNAGSIFNVVSKSGGNLVHGELFFHVHNSVTDASDYFSHKRPPQETYQFGGAVGGPIIRDKLFYELEYQSYVGNSPLQGNAATLSLADRGLNVDGTPHLCTPATGIPAGDTCADFSGDVKSGGNVNALIVNPVYTSPTTSVGTNPTTAISQLNSTWAAQGNSGTNPCIGILQAMTSSIGGYLPGAQIPSECLDPTIQRILKAGYMPLPDTVLGTSQFLYSSLIVPRPQHEYGGFARVDYNLSARQQMVFRFYRTENSDYTSIGANDSSYGVPNYERDQNGAIITAGSVSHTLIVTPNLLNTATLGYKRYDYSVLPADSSDLGTFGSLFSRPGHHSMPYMNIETRVHLGNSQNAYTQSVNENTEFRDDVSWQKGRHNFQFGVNYLYLQYLNHRDNVGSFTFEGNPGYTGSQAADFMMGLIYSMSVGNGQTIAGVQNAIYGYGQDTWRILPRLTLSLGVRYELPFMWRQPKGESATFIRGYQSQVFPNAPAGIAFVGDRGVPDSLVSTDYSNVSPRIGIAYDVFGNGRTAVRAGFGSFYDAIPATVVGLTQPYTYRAFYQNPAGSITNPLAGLPAIPADFTKGNASFPGLASIIYPDPNFKNGYTYAFNLGVQQQVSSGSTIEVLYIGRLGRKLLIPEDQNPSIIDCSGSYYASNPSLYCPTAILSAQYPLRSRYPGFNYGGQGVVRLTSAATSNYNALQVVYQQRTFKNLTVTANYSYSRTMDIASTLGTSNQLSQPDNIGFDYGPSSQNATHILNVGYRLTFPNARRGSAWVKNIVNNWSLNGMYNLRSGHPFNLTFGGDESGTDEQPQRVYLTPGVSPFLPSNRHRADKIKQWFNTAAFSKPAAFTFGNIGRNSMVGPAYTNIQMSLAKSIREDGIRKGMRSQIRLEVFNLFNTVNLGNPRATYSASSAQATTFGSINASGQNASRRIQFGFIQYF
ncbi:TonB-dependent receptor domain-containing protein [Granulicella cerasi]|uniref:TonB-dependent receptor domain-containing protein n=1 Tax=Granulicella cerasi TaxID=741063 RepID=A0ABW1Z6X7_9BACT|nr:TonB-dependent receptor [Granulicella cerasi]